MTSPSGIPAELLRPSLSEKPPAKAPYSVQTGAVVAFFGGPAAAIVMALVNAWRLGRLRRDAPWLAAVVLGTPGFLAWWWLTASGLAFSIDVVALLGTAGTRIVERALALLIFGVAAYAHRREQRTTDMFDRARPNGVGMGIALIVFDWVVMTGVYAWMA